MRRSKSVKMVPERVCRFNQFGFCKFKNNCFKKHVDITCENEKCFKSDCELRHPKKCRYFSEYSYCKFGEYCRFGHEKVKKSNIDKEIEKLRCEIETSKKVIEAKDSEIKEKDFEIRKLLEDVKIKDKEKLDKKIGCLEKKKKNLEIKNNELIDQVKAYREENESLRDQNAVNDMLFLDFKERMRDKYLYNTEDEESDYESNDEIREKKREMFRKTKAEARRNDINIICKLCDFKGKNESGLKTHMTRKHK